MEGRVVWKRQIGDAALAWKGETGGRHVAVRLRGVRLVHHELQYVITVKCPLSLVKHHWIFKDYILYLSFWNIEFWLLSLLNTV